MPVPTQSDRLIHRSAARTGRFAALIVAKAPDVNAALIVAPARGCRPQDVQIRYAQLSLEVMAALLQRQNAGALTNVEADRQVWRRLAAQNRTSVNSQLRVTARTTSPARVTPMHNALPAGCCRPWSR